MTRPSPTGVHPDEHRVAAAGTILPASHGRRQTATFRDGAPARVHHSLGDDLLTPDAPF